MTTLKLQGVPKALSPVAPRNARLADLPGTVEVKSGELKIRTGGSGKRMLKLTLPAKHYYSKSAPSRWQVLKADSSPVLLNEASAQGEVGAGGLIEIPVEGGGSEARGELVVEALAYYCDEAGVCKVAGVVFKVPVSVGSGGAAEVALEHTFGGKAPDFGDVFRPAEK